MPTGEHLTLQRRARRDRLTHAIPIADDAFVDAQQLAQQLVAEATTHVAAECLATEVGIRLNAARQLAREHGTEPVDTASEITEGAQRVEELGCVHRRSAVERCSHERLDEGRGPHARLGERHVHTFDVEMLLAYQKSNRNTNNLEGTGDNRRTWIPSDSDGATGFTANLSRSARVSAASARPHLRSPRTT